MRAIAIVVGAAERDRHKGHQGHEGHKGIKSLCVLCVLCVAAPGSGLPQRPIAARHAAPAVVRVGVLEADGRYSIAAMPIETYVARVLAGEAARASPPAALEALAIAVRTFALANRGRHRADGFDLCDQTHCQVLRGATPATERAAQATAGELLVRNGAPAAVYYTASCGGRTEKPSAVWPGAEDPPFLPVKDDDACQGAPAWSVQLHASDLLRALHAAGFRGGHLNDMRIVSRSASGRVARLEIEGLQPSTISGQDLRVTVGRAIGWQHLKSTAFTLQRDGDVYRFDGHGSGHGVGLCVIGSARLAEQGRSAQQILARYYPGLDIRARGSEMTTIETPAPAAPAPVPRASASPAPVAASLPEGDEGGQNAIERQALTARDELARTLGVQPPAITLRVHPTTDEYERATGLPWFSAGTAVNHELHLVPVGALRDRGVLDQTIRRGLVHAMIDGVLKDRPAWVREGAALYFAELQHSAPAQTRAACPTDNELLRPVSIGALSNAYARAKACFARQIASGRSWRDVR